MPRWLFLHSVDDVEPLRRQSLCQQVAFEAEQRVSQGIARLCPGRVMGVNDDGTAMVSGPAKGFADDAEDSDSVVAVDVNFRDG